jgi:hypothetical protein
MVLHVKVVSVGVPLAQSAAADRAGVPQNVGAFSVAQQVFRQFQ